jgi:hypothetical protein
MNNMHSKLYRVQNLRTMHHVETVPQRLCVQATSKLFKHSRCPGRGLNKPPCDTTKKLCRVCPLSCCQLCQYKTKCKDFNNFVVELGMLDVNEGDTNKERGGRNVFLQGGGKIQRNE